jgi:prepilin-type N-terminal cleavage/methylation domain-containing protein
MFKVQCSRINVKCPELNLEPGTWNLELGTRNRRPRERGYTLFEFAAAIVILSILAAVLLTRLAFYQEMAEKAAMESMVRVIKTGLQIRLAELIIGNRQGEAETLEVEDPMQWLEPRPHNYAGAYREPPTLGKWYFDATARQLVYVVNTGNRLDLATAADAKQIRFRARLLKDRLNVGGAVVESVTGITLTAVTPYRWR